MWPTRLLHPSICSVSLRNSNQLGDFKQLPPATSKPPFIVLPWVYEKFDFRVLRPLLSGTCNAGLSLRTRIRRIRRARLRC